MDKSTFLRCQIDSKPPKKRTRLKFNGPERVLTMSDATFRSSRKQDQILLLN